VWDELTARTGEDAQLTISFQIFLTIACLLAAIGAITDTSVLVVGAMVLGPEFGPLAAIAVGVVLRRRALVRVGARALLIGFPVAMAVTAVATLAFDATGLLTAAELDRQDQVEFIYDVGPFSFIVAVLAGLAGVLALTSAKSGSLVGCSSPSRRCRRRRSPPWRSSRAGSTRPQPQRRSCSSTWSGSCSRPSWG
jgi:uncharacterized hydrophobic protein (TIGR00271 family)